NRIIVALRQRQKQTVAPHQAQRDRRLSERQPLASLESADGLDLSLAQVAGGQDLLLNRILRCLDSDDVLRLFLKIWFDRHGLKLSILDSRSANPDGSAKDITPAIVSRPVPGLRTDTKRPRTIPSLNLVRLIDSYGSQAAACRANSRPR